MMMMMKTRTWIFGSLGVLLLIVVASLLAFLIPRHRSDGGETKKPSCFRAAVLDHVQQVPKDNTTTAIELNLQMFERAAAKAAEQSADIIVYPENGIIFQLATRKDVLKNAEAIPNEKVVICTESYAVSHPILHRLACIAKTNQIYLAANIIDVQSCEKDCREDKKYAFNTAVLFDRGGTFLAKYHKIHPFGNTPYDLPPQEELVVIDTEIGRLGLQVCFDLIYEKPGVTLTTKKLIDTMVFPTWWFDELPFLSASQFQMSWAFGNKINLLASNIHFIEMGSKGSGIYGGGIQQFEVINNVDTKTRLLVATLPINPLSVDAKCDFNAQTYEIPQIVPGKENSNYIPINLNLDETEVVPIDFHTNNISKCKSGVCCTLEYYIDNLLTNKTSIDEYYLILTNRTRTESFPWTEEICSLVHCSQLIDEHACSSKKGDTNLPSNFFYAKLSGNYSVDAHIYPSAIGLDHSVLHTENKLWSFESVKGNDPSKQQFIVTFGTEESKNNTLQISYPLSTLSMYGRVYSRDPPFHWPLSSFVKL